MGGPDFFTVSFSGLFRTRSHLENDDSTQTTNIPWKFSEYKIQRVFGRWYCSFGLWRSLCATEASLLKLVFHIERFSIANNAQRCTNHITNTKEHGKLVTTLCYEHWILGDTRLVQVNKQPGHHGNLYRSAMNNANLAIENVTKTKYWDVQYNASTIGCAFSLP